KGFNDGLALTFDDGPDLETTPKILEILRTKNVKATFFVIGKKAEQFPEVLKTIDKEGHLIANHSYQHSYFIGTFGTKKLTEDIEKCSAIIEKIIGKKPLFFRPPFGVTNPRYLRALKKLNLASIGWSGRSFDTVNKSKNLLVKRVKKSLNTTEILLFHDTQKVTVEALPEIIEYCKEKGIKIVPLQELIS
ncbi:MAG: polysaccharide deacetylase family protein, partial [Bacteroidia bacterium]|nr:polysaccharide deacetylase family protein [Bacteroidia bacterium]